MNSAHVLIVDDDEDIRRLFRLCLEAEGYRVKEASDFQEVKANLLAYRFDAVLLDIFLGKDHGLDVLSFLTREAPFSRVIIMTGQESVSLAVSSYEGGAAGFVSKTDGPAKVIEVLKAKLTAEPTVSSSTGDTGFDGGIIGRSAEIQRVMTQIGQMKDVDSTVLILGESGTGKELVARALHKNSKRSHSHFEAINCGAIPETLLESELFGHRRGAFTDARSDRKGLFEICDGGTLVLDEIGDMPLALQVKLLRVLQEREVRPLGSNTTVKIDTRVIACTHRDLLEEVRAGRFRQDLYFRLSVLQIHIPALRERREDVELLVNTFVDKFNKQFVKQIQKPTRELMARLKAAHWAGNVRELQNAIERAVVLAQGNEISLEHIFYGVDQGQVPQLNEFQTPFDEDSIPLALSEARDLFEKTYLRKLLAKSKGNVSQAARISGKHRVEIYRLLEKHKVDHHEYRVGGRSANQTPSGF